MIHFESAARAGDPADVAIGDGKHRNHLGSHQVCALVDPAPRPGDMPGVGVVVVARHRKDHRIDAVDRRSRIGGRVGVGAVVIGQHRRYAERGRSQQGQNQKSAKHRPDLTHSGRVGQRGEFFMARAT